MPERPARDVAADLVRSVAAAREAFLDSATRWVDLRHRFLIKTGKQPGAGRRDRGREH